MASRILGRIAAPALLLAVVAGFYWKILLVSQYTWLENPDLANQVLPWRQMQAREIQRGYIPLWNPYEWGGHSMLGQMQPGLAYPLNWLIFLAPFRHGFIRYEALHWYFAFIHFLGAWFCYLLCRDLGASRGAAVVAGLVFGLGGWMGSTDWPVMLNGAVWAPLVCLFLLRVVQGRQPFRNAGLAGAFLGASLLSGHHQAPVYTAVVAAGVWVYGFFHWRRKLLLPAACFSTLAVLVGGLQMFPAIEYGRLSWRWVNAPNPVGWSDKVPYTVHTTYSMPPLGALGAIVPNLSEHTQAFIGLVAVSFALLAMVAGWSQTHVRVLAGISAAGMLLSLGSFNVFHGILYAVAPWVNKARNPSMAIFLFHLGVAALAAFGMDRFAEREEWSARWTRRLIIALGAYAVALWALGFGMWLTRTPLAHEEVELMPLVALLLAGVVYGWHRGHLSRGGALVSLGALALLELGVGSAPFRFNHRDSGRPFLDRLNRDADVAAFLRSRPDWPRFEANRNDIPYNFGDWHGLDEFDAYTASLPVNIARVQANWRARMLFSVRYYLARSPARDDQVEAFTGQSGLKVFENPEAFPRVWAVHATLRARNADDLAFAPNLPFSELRRAAILEDDIPPLDLCSTPDRLVFRERTPNSLRIDVEMGCRGMVVISESYFPGWMALVDGKSTRVYPVYGVLRGVIVERGRHEIEMKYRPFSVMAGSAATFLGLLAALMLAFSGRATAPNGAGSREPIS